MNGRASRALRNEKRGSYKWMKKFYKLSSWKGRTRILAKLKTHKQESFFEKLKRQL